MKEVKLLFLPHCLREDYKIKLKEEAEKKEYKVYIAHGGSIVKKILSGFSKIDRIVGIACNDEIKLALEYTKPLAESGTIIKTINLSKDGCKDTEVDLSSSLQIL
jgi:hypothetical protein